jgi:serine/threonine protein kinase/ABC-type branched-subunit amino acid transport system substrate-binding protein
MQCPRCGYPTDDAATTCLGCGLPLSPYLRASTDHPHPSLGGGISQPIDGIWREDDGSDGGPGAGVPGDGPPSWLMRALRASDSGSPPIGAGAPTSQPTVPPYGFTPPPAFRRDLPSDSGAGPQSVFPYPISPQNLQPSRSGAGWFTPTPANSGSSAFGQLVPVPGQGNSSLAPLNMTSSSGQLMPGVVLKGGRYRLIQPFYSSSTIQPPRNEPPLMIASDTELPSGRVLIQELLLNAVRPEDSENARRAIAQRLTLLRSNAAMPRLVDHFGQQWRHFLVFELPSGDLMSDRLQRAHGPLPETLAIRLALQVTEVLEIFEQQLPPFIHGNLSPASLILRPSGQVVVIGCSPHVLLYPDGIVDHPPAGGIAGYAAPEQVRGQVNSRSDIFALCAIVHHAVTGVAPAARSNAVHPPARRLNPDVSLELEEVLGRGMRPSWTQRYQSAAELRSALERLAYGRVTHVPEELRDQDARAVALVPMRDARGRFVLPRQRRLQSPLFLFGVILCLLVLIGAAVLFAAMPRTGSASTVPTPNNLAQMFQQQNIGLSDGDFVFDTRRVDSSYKTQGSRDLASGDLTDARASFLNAVAIDRSDAEAAIYAEDMKISLGQAPYITVVVGTAFDPNADAADIAAARSELEGIYLAQHRIDTSHILPGGLTIQVMILNSGLDAKGAITATDVVRSQINLGNSNHIVGIIGWPEITQTQLARSELKSVGLPLITPTGSDDTMTNFEASLFRMVPLNSVQAQELADVAVYQMQATSIVVLSDPKDQLSNSMAYNFITRVNSDQSTVAVSVHSIPYTSGANVNFHAIAEQAIKSDQADIIYLSTGQSGGDMDSINLGRAVIAASRAAGVTPPRILADSRAYTPALLGLGSSPTASYARANATPAVLSDLFIETPASAQTWWFLGLPSTAADAFDSAFANQYDTTLSPDELYNPNAIVILSYDALDLLSAAASSSISKPAGTIVYPTLTEVRDGLLSFTPAHPFIGMSGALSYDLSGDVNGDLPNADAGPGRAFAVLDFVPFVFPLSDGMLASAQIAYVTGGPSTTMFCGGPTVCAPRS